MKTQNQTPEKTFRLFCKGGSIGEIASNKENGNWNPAYGRFIKEFSTKEEAKAQAKEYNKRLSPGEKSYYGIKYHVK